MEQSGEPSAASASRFLDREASWLQFNSRVLLDQGLDYLTKRGFRTVILYVDGDNTGAVRLYERAGFHTRSVDLEYRLRG